MGMTSSNVKNLDVHEFDRILKSDERSNYQIIDVREQSELRSASIPGSDIVNLPLGSQAVWSKELQEGKLLDANKPTICFCHHGMRSMRVANFLASQANFSEVHNVNGGIHAYATKVDRSVGTY